jgi:hypothetical protein
MFKSLVDTGKLVAALNEENGAGKFRSRPLDVGDVQTIQQRRWWGWDDVADSDVLEEVAGLVRDFLPDVAPDGRVTQRLVIALFGNMDS